MSSSLVVQRMGIGPMIVCLVLVGGGRDSEVQREPVHA